MVSDAVVLDFENAEVRSSDFESLKPEGWLTGEIINFYWTFLERREFCTETSILFLGTYTSYRISNAENATVTDNISAQLSEELKHRQVVLIPLNHRSHWSLLVYCRLTKTFYHYDSISKHNRNFAERAVGRFLRVLEPRAKDGFYFKAMQTPQQNNDFDCGIYVLAIAEELARRYIIHTKRSTRGKRPLSVKSTRAAIPPPSSQSLPASTQKYHGSQRREDSDARAWASTARQPSHELGRSNTAPSATLSSATRTSHAPAYRRPSASGAFATASSPSRALASDLLMPKFAQAFSGFNSPFVSLSKDPSGTYIPEPMLKGGGSNSTHGHGTSSKLHGGSNSQSARMREERLQAEIDLLDKAGLPRDFWQVTVEDIEYPHCMRQRIRSLILGLQQQQQQTQAKWRKRY